MQGWPPLWLLVFKPDGVYADVIILHFDNRECQKLWALKEWRIYAITPLQLISFVIDDDVFS
jgi:hypothetical protein